MEWKMTPFSGDVIIKAPAEARFSVDQSQCKLIRDKLLIGYRTITASIPQVQN
jgi:hypothetical protein